MGSAAALRTILVNPTPERVAMAIRHIEAPRVDLRKLKAIFNYTHIIHNSYDPTHNLRTYLACGLKMYSPGSLVDARVKRGVCKAMADVAGITVRDASYYIRTYAAHDYGKRKGFAELVDSIVERLG